MELELEEPGRHAGRDARLKLKYKGLELRGEVQVGDRHVSSSSIEVVADARENVQ